MLDPITDIPSLDVSAPGLKAADIGVALRSAMALHDAGDATAGADKIPVIKSPNLLRLLSLPYVDLKGHKGAVIGGHGGAWAWLQEAILEAQNSGRPVFATPGTYDFGDEAEQISLGNGNIKIYGVYGQSIFKVFEGTDAEPKSLIYDSGAVPEKGFVFFEGLEFQGTFGQVGRTTVQGESPLFLDHYTDVKLSYCRFKNFTSGATNFHFCEQVSADHCSFSDCAGDGFRTRESKYVSATNNYFRRMGDDSISNHGGKYFPDYDPDDGSPRREGFVAIGNIFGDVSACIANLAGRQSIVTGNVANRFRNYFYFCNQDAFEGEHPAHNIKVANNIGLNLITNIGGYVIISTAAPRGAAVTSGVVPGQPHSSGAFENVWDWQNADALDLNDPFPPMSNIDISGNLFERTLPAVSKYSDWGFGKWGTKTYGEDIAITDDMMRPPSGINIPIGKVTTIRNNSIVHTDDAIFLNAQAGVSPVMIGGVIEGNAIRDFISRGVALTGVSGKLINLKIDDNTIEGDFRHLAANSNPDGTYTTGSGTPTAIDLGTSLGATISGNRISNVARLLPTPENHICSDNIVLIDPAGYGDNAGNKGVRNMLAVEHGFKYVIAYCDPTDTVNYGTIKNIMLEASDVQPTTGYYIKGHFVKNTNKAREGRFALLGWMRVTTGNSHTPDVDWMPEYLDSREALQQVVSWTPGVIANGGTASVVITLTGIAYKDFVLASFDGSLQGCTLSWVWAPDAVTVTITNNTGSSKTFVATDTRAWGRKS
jgi:hypothetical protein